MSFYHLKLGVIKINNGSKTNKFRKKTLPDTIFHVIGLIRCIELL